MRRNPVATWVQSNPSMPRHWLELLALAMQTDHPGTVPASGENGTGAVAAAFLFVSAG